MHPPTFARRAALIPLTALTLTGCDTLEAVLDDPPDAGWPEAAVGDPCDPERPKFCVSTHRIAGCGEDGRVEWRSLPCSESGVITCAEGNGTAECVHRGHPPCDADYCSADAAMMRCGETGHVIDRDPCPTGQVCAEGHDTLDCVLPERAPCVEDGCSADARSVAYCNPTGFVDLRVDCAADQICASAEGEAACVAEAMTPCERSERACADAGDAVLVTRCYAPLGLSQGTRTLYTCDAEAGGCAMADGIADCALDEDIPCEVEHQEVSGGTVLSVGDAPVICLGDLLVRCNDFGRLAGVARCEQGCQIVRGNERTWLGACN